MLFNIWKFKSYVLVSVVFFLVMKEFVFVTSRTDKASSNMAHTLVSRFGFTKSGEIIKGNPVWKNGCLKLIMVDSDMIMLEGLDKYFSPHAYVFLSKHQSESGIPALTAHFPGNFSQENIYGGSPKELAVTYPSFHKDYIQRLWEERDRVPGFRIVTEPTHHGPTSHSRPVIFIELGSSEKEWSNMNAAEVICKVLLNTIDKLQEASKICIALGGPHYSEKFTSLLFESEYAIGAIAPKYSLHNLDSVMFKQMIERCVEKVEYVVIDWKGLGKEKERILALVEEAKLSIVKV